jgi:hypothetical protein
MRRVIWAGAAADGQHPRLAAGSGEVVRRREVEAKLRDLREQMGPRAPAGPLTGVFVPRRWKTNGLLAVIGALASS